MTKTKKNRKKNKKETPASHPTEEGVTEDEKSGDFGGVPQRDLKKNLGCG